jgi:hypothetical protein
MLPSGRRLSKQGRHALSNSLDQPIEIRSAVGARQLNESF